MKKIINYSGIPGLVLISALFFLPFSCNKDRVQDNPNSVISSQLIKVSGEDANAATKTTLSGLVTSWIVTTDKVGIYSPQARTATAGGGSTVVNAEFTAASSGTSSNFTGTMYWGAASTSHTFYAYYPYTAGSAASSVVPVSLATAQTQSAAGNNAHIGALDFMIATPVTVTSPANTNAIANEVHLKYNHLFTVLEFQIKGSGTLKAVKLSGSNTLAFSGGTIDITQATPAAGAAYTLASQTGTATQAVVTLTTPATLTSTNADTKVYMVINPGTQTGNCLIGVSSDGTTWKYISKTALSGGFLRGNKYVVSVDAATATDPVDDIDGNTYTTVTIGTQVWMAQNLKTTKYNDGSNIPNVTGNTAWGALSTGAYCDYDNTSSNSTTYGRLYNWYAVDNNASTKVASNGGKNICPVGWHVSTDAEWTTLSTYLGGTSVAGGKLKESGTAHWTTPNPGATNESGFTALPGGYRYYDGTYFSGIGSYGYWWSSSPDGVFADIRYIYYNNSNITRSYNNLKFGHSVRCVKD